MSIKIYRAWRIPLARLTEATDILHNNLSKNFYRKWAEALDRIYAEGHWREIEPPSDNEFADCGVAMERGMAEIWEKARDVRELHVAGFWFLIDGELAYILPLGNFPLSPIPDWFEEYGYWNNTDRPDALTQAEWDARGEVWDRIWVSAPNREYQHYVVDPSEGFFAATGSYTLRWVKERTEALKHKQQGGVE